MRRCDSCLYRDDCAETCIGYVINKETSDAKDAYEELLADIAREES